VLKKALGHRCPPEILNRPKWGFDTPLRRWVSRPELYNILKRLPDGKLIEQGWVSREPLAGMVATPELAMVHARRLWALLILEVWLNVHKRPSPPSESLLDLLCVAA
jgi:hypothetical protein